MERREIELWYLESFSTNDKPVNIVGANETDIWPLAGELREIIVAKSRRAGGAHWWGRTAKTTAKIIHTGKTHWKISHHSGTLITSSKKREEGRPSKLKNRKEAFWRKSWEKEKVWNSILTILTALVVLGKLDFDSLAEEVRVIDSIDSTLGITLVDSDKS